MSHKEFWKPIPCVVQRRFACRDDELRTLIEALRPYRDYPGVLLEIAKYSRERQDIADEAMYRNFS